MRIADYPHAIVHYADDGVRIYFGKPLDGAGFALLVIAIAIAVGLLGTVMCIGGPVLLLRAPHMPGFTFLGLLMAALIGAQPLT